MYAGRGLPMNFLSLQSHPHVNAPDHENILSQLNLTDRFTNQANAGRIYLTHLRRFR